GYESMLEERFLELASDPPALEAELARRAAAASTRADGIGAPSGKSGDRSIRRRIAAEAARAARGAERLARRHAGPSVRALQRRGIEVSALVAEIAATRVQVISDSCLRLTEGTLPLRALRRILPYSTTFESGTTSPPLASRLDGEGVFGDADIDGFLIERVKALDPHQVVLHTECGEGGLVRRLSRLGLLASGADPHAARGSLLHRRGTFEALAAARGGSLDAVIVTGVPDRVTPFSARALVKLLASRLAPGGTLVIVSSNPAQTSKADPVGSDLARAGPLHARTWSHLLACCGLSEIAVREGASRTAFCVAARRPRTK
ncbi:MAG: hypothetical protein ACRDZT_02485, partial [Acidimicrobiales bacterium]